MVCFRNEVGPFYEELLKIGELSAGQQRGGMVAVVAIGQQQQGEPLQQQSI